MDEVGFGRRGMQRTLQKRRSKPFPRGGTPSPATHGSSGAKPAQGRVSEVAQSWLRMLPEGEQLCPGYGIANTLVGEAAKVHCPFLPSQLTGCPGQRGVAPGSPTSSRRTGHKAVCKTISAPPSPNHCCSDLQESLPAQHGLQQDLLRSCTRRHGFFEYY